MSIYFGKNILQDSPYWCCPESIDEFSKFRDRLNELLQTMLPPKANTFIRQIIDNLSARINTLILPIEASASIEEVAQTTLQRPLRSIPKEVSIQSTSTCMLDSANEEFMSLEFVQELSSLQINREAMLSSKESTLATLYIIIAGALDFVIERTTIRDVQASMNTFLHSYEKAYEETAFQLALEENEMDNNTLHLIEMLYLKTVFHAREKLDFTK